MALTVAEVLEYLHGLNPPVYYGDLKPENLMLTEEGTLYLVDFGSAVATYDGIGRSYLGTVGYAAPEQFQGQVRENSDVYGLGKTFLALARYTPKKDFIVYAPLYLILSRCCMQNEGLRYRNITEVKMRLLKILRSRQGKRRMALPP